MCYSCGWWEQMFAPAYLFPGSEQPPAWVRATPSSWTVMRAVCKEEGPGQRKWKGRLLSRKPAQTRSRQKLLADLSHDLCRGLSLRQLEPARQGWIRVSLYTQQGYTPVGSCPAFTWFSEAGDVFKGLIFNLHPSEEENL